MSLSPLAAVARALVAPGKGILAADESTGTAAKRFAPLGIPQTEEMRRDYRDMLFTTPGIGSYFSGVILYDETIRQNGKSGRPFVEILREQGILSGIKLDIGPQPLPFAPGETITEGLDGLRKRVEEYVRIGATFAKWRAIIEISKSGAAQRTPTPRAILANAHALARYAAICQEGGLVPIVEPELLMDGDHDQTIERSREEHEIVLRAVFEQLAELGVTLEEMILKPSMVIPGEKAAKAPVAEVARHTVEVLLRTVPAATPGIAFLSGGQGDEEATEVLNQINRVAAERRAPWPLTFSYGRALQQAALHAWSGKSANIPQAQAALLKRAKLNGLAALGKYEAAMERETALAGSGR